MAAHAPSASSARPVPLRAERHYRYSDPTQEHPPHATPTLRRLPRPAPSRRRASDVAVPPRSRPRGAPGQARLRRILVRRAPLQRLGNDRVARDVPRRRGRADQAHQAGHRGRVAALSPSVQRRATHGAARPHDGRARDLRLGAGRAGVRRAHARRRSDGAARPPGRGDQHHPPAVQRRARHRQVRVVHAEGRRACNCCRCRRRCRSPSPRRSARRA